MSEHKLVCVREDGLVTESEFLGWHSETAVFLYFNQFIADKRAWGAYVFQRADAQSKWYCRSEWRRPANPS